MRRSRCSGRRSARGPRLRLDSPPQPRIFDPATVIKGISDPIDKLKALAEAKRQTGVNQLEQQFVDVAATWANRNDIGREAFATLGVPSNVLRKAFGTATPKCGGSVRTRVSTDALQSGIRAKNKGTKLTVAAVADELGGSPATVRKVLDQLTQDGVLANKGPDPDYGDRGRAPIIFQRV